MPDETKAVCVCPKCGAELFPGHKRTFNCGTQLSDEGEIVTQSPACTITALTAQLARANKQIDDILADGARECPKCDASIDSLVAREEGCVNCDRLEAQQQLADARLLAKAANREACWWRDRVYIVVAHNEPTLCFEYETRDSLPILTPRTTHGVEKGDR